MSAQVRPVDYDRIAAHYDAHRHWEAEIPLRLLGRATGGPVNRLAPAGAILELGCGTGNLTRWLLETWAGPVVALDLSKGMLAKARTKLGEARLVRGSACCLPFRPRSFDAALGSFFLHHLDAAGRMRLFGVLRSLLAPRGRRHGRSHGVAFLTSSHEQIRSSYLTRWFPAVADIDCARFPDLELLREELAAAGFADIAIEAVLRPMPRGDASYAEKIRARFVSTLELVPEAEFRAGMEGLERQLAMDGHLGDMTWHGTIVSARCE